MTTYEPFTAGFTGTLTTWQSANGTRQGIGKPFPRVVKGQAFVMKIDLDKSTVVMLPVLLPDWRWR